MIGIRIVIQSKTAHNLAPTLPVACSMSACIWEKDPSSILFEKVLMLIGMHPKTGIGDKDTQLDIAVLASISQHLYGVIFLPIDVLSVDLSNKYDCVFDFPRPQTIRTLRTFIPASFAARRGFDRKQTVFPIKICNPDNILLLHRDPFF